MNSAFYAGIDVGGTSILAVIIDEHGQVKSSARRKTRAALGAQAVIGRIISTLDKVLAKAHLAVQDLSGIGLGIPGPVDTDNGQVFFCANLGPTWDNLKLADSIEERIGLRPRIENDVNVAAVGEYAYGAAKGYQDALVIFIGTGIGGGLILDGKLRSGTRFGAAEVGHTVLLADGPLCSCGQRGHAEALAARPAIARYIDQAIAGGRETIIPDLLAARNKDTVTSSIIQQACEKGDQVTLEAVARAQYYLGLLIGNCVNIIDPARIVLGGGLVDRMGQAYVDSVAVTAFQNILNKRRIDELEIVPAALGDLSGAMGAAHLAHTDPR